ncbi:TPA: hypothetical protein DCE37_02305 [Candidatus Latescibacteria bacterium]|nr:hypothetical protein [Candidatus Latescibacterota bacterium]
MAKVYAAFRAPYSQPNGMQMTDEGLWVADQVTDRCALIETENVNRYGRTLVLREIETESSNTSGMTYGDGALWLAANGPGAKYRPARDTDFESGANLKVDPMTGDTLGHWSMPEPGGTHGIEWDHYDEGTMWVSTKGNTMTQLKVEDRSVVRKLDLPHGRSHGVVRVEDGIWIAFTSDLVIIKFDIETNEEMDRIDIPESHPAPHGVSAYPGGFIYCDSSTGWIGVIETGV